jgi:hypothetical protein
VFSMNINTCKRCLSVQYMVDFGGILHPLNGLLIIFKNLFIYGSLPADKLSPKKDVNLN